jgi:hypothetical protein
MNARAANQLPKLHLASLRSINLHPAHGLRRLARVFFATGSVVFILLILERSLAIVGAFSELVVMCFLAWLLAFVVSPLVDGATGGPHIGREGVDLGTVTAAIRAAYPEATPEEVLAEAADQAEAIYATQREEQLRYE